MNFAERTRRLSAWSKAAVARKSGLNVSTVGLLLNGRMPFTPYYRERIASALGIDSNRVDEMVSDDE